MNRSTLFDRSLRLLVIGAVLIAFCLSFSVRANATTVTAAPCLKAAKDFNP